MMVMAKLERIVDKTVWLPLDVCTKILLQIQARRSLAGDRADLSRTGERAPHHGCHEESNW